MILYNRMLYLESFPFTQGLRPHKNSLLMATYILFLLTYGSLTVLLYKKWDLIIILIPPPHILLAELLRST